jgi:hypothetical protein
MRNIRIVKTSKYNSPPHAGSLHSEFISFVSAYKACNLTTQLRYLIVLTSLLADPILLPQPSELTLTQVVEGDKGSRRGDTSYIAQQCM